jgi:RimJ/RimL family protein N-acetyltransferase
MASFTEALAAENLDTLIQTEGTGADEWVRILEAFSAQGRAFSLLALDGGKVVGMLDLKAGKWPATRHSASLGMSVARDHRGQGIGARLLERAIGEVRRWEGFSRLELEVVAHNAPAIALYEDFGFRKEGVKRGAIRIDGRAADMVMMALTW